MLWSNLKGVKHGLKICHECHFSLPNAPRSLRPVILLPLLKVERKYPKRLGSTLKKSKMVKSAKEVFDWSSKIALVSKTLPGCLGSVILAKRVFPQLLLYFIFPQTEVHRGVGLFSSITLALHADLAS